MQDHNLLKPEGIKVLSGTYDKALSKSLKLPDLDADEFAAVKAS